VFIASPGDLQPERAAIREVIQEVNQIMGADSVTRFEVVGWESHARPGVGSEPQEVISKQIGNEYEIFLGMLWTRMGTPTSTARSGTEQEFLEAMNRYRENPDSLQVLFYFKDAPITPSNIDAKQLLSVKEFKESIPDLGVYYGIFQHQAELSRLLRIHLAQIAREFGKTWGVAPRTGATTISVEARLLVEWGSRVESSVREENEEGLLDSLETGITAFDELSAITDEMTKELGELGNVLTESTIQTQALNSTGQQLNVKEARRIVDGVASSITEFSDKTSKRLPDFSTTFARGIDAFTRVILIQKGFNGAAGGDNLAVSSTQVRGLVRTIEGSRSDIANFRDVVGLIPRMTKSLGRAKVYLLLVLDQFVVEYDKAVGLLLALAKTIEAVESIDSKSQQSALDDTL